MTDSILNLPLKSGNQKILELKGDIANHQTTGYIFRPKFFLLILHISTVNITGIFFKIFTSFWEIDDLTIYNIDKLPHFLSGNPEVPGNHWA